MLIRSRVLCSTFDLRVHKLEYTVHISQCHFANLETEQDTNAHRLHIRCLLLPEILHTFAFFHFCRPIIFSFRMLLFCI